MLVEDNIGRAEDFRSWLTPWARLVWAQSASGALGLIRRDPGRVYGGALLDHDLGERAMTQDDESLSGTDVARALCEHYSFEEFSGIQKRDGLTSHSFSTGRLQIRSSPTSFPG